MDKTEIPARDEGKSYPIDKFPAFCTGPNGEGDVFNSEAEVPAGWKMPDGAVKGGKAKAPAPAPAAPVATTETAPVEDAVELDADGWPWTAELHAATKSKTKAGLWRMNVGVSRPAPKTAPLDL